MTDFDAVILEVLRDIWPADEDKRADEMLRCIKRNHANRPPDQQDSAALADALKLARLLR